MTFSHTNSTLASLCYTVSDGLYSQLFGLLADILRTSHNALCRVLLLFLLRAHCGFFVDVCFRLLPFFIICKGVTLILTIDALSMLA